MLMLEGLSNRWPHRLSSASAPISMTIPSQIISASLDGYAFHPKYRVLEIQNMIAMRKMGQFIIQLSSCGAVPGSYFWRHRGQCHATPSCAYILPYLDLPVCIHPAGQSQYTASPPQSSHLHNFNLQTLASIGTPLLPLYAVRSMN
jgi:hypothetical protein